MIEFSEQTLGIISTITLALIWVGIAIMWSPGYMKKSKIKYYNAVIIVDHLIVIGYLLQGKLFWAALWVGMIMLTFWTRSLAKRSQALHEELERIKAELDKKVIEKISSDFGLDPADFEIQRNEESNSGTILYKGEIFDASEHELVENNEE